MAENLIHLATYSSSIEANIIKSKLEDCDIHVFLYGENIANLLPNFALGAGGGIKLMVPESCANQALQILQESQAASTSTENIPSECPKCHSNDVRKDRFFKTLVGISSVFFFLPSASWNFWKCQNCRHRWRSN